MNDSPPRRPAPGNVTIRRALAADAAQLVAFNQAMAFETEHKALPTEIVAAGVAAVLRDERLGFYLSAEVGGRVVGGLLVTYEWSDWRNGKFYWIQSVFVEPEHRGRGIYRALHEQVRAEALARGDACGLRLYVEESNHGAQQVYAALGMTGSSYRIFEESLPCVPDPR